MAKESKKQQATVGRVMHEFKHGELKSAGRKVRNPKQAIAIGMSEAGASRNQPSSRRRAAPARDQGGETREALYREATSRGIAGRSRMTKEQLRQALGR
jgi:hypothetical protein